MHAPQYSRQQKIQNFRTKRSFKKCLGCVLAVFFPIICEVFCNNILFWDYTELALNDAHLKGKSLHAAGFCTTSAEPLADGQKISTLKTHFLIRQLHKVQTSKQINLTRLNYFFQKKKFLSCVNVDDPESGQENQRKPQTSIMAGCPCRQPSQ